MLGIPPRPARSSLTTAAGTVGIVLSALWGLFGVAALLLALFIADVTNDIEGESESVRNLDDLGDAAGGLLAVVGVAILAAVAWSVVTSAKLVQRRRWGRVATIVTFSVWAALSVVFFFLALVDSGDDEDGRADRFGEETGESDSSGAAGGVIWLINAAACVTVVALAAQRAVGADVEAAESGLGPGGVASPYAAPPPGWGSPAYGPAPRPGWGSPVYGPGPPGSGSPPPPAVPSGGRPAPATPGPFAAAPAPAAPGASGSGGVSSPGFGPLEGGGAGAPQPSSPGPYWLAQASLPPPAQPAQPAQPAAESAEPPAYDPFAPPGSP